MQDGALDDALKSQRGLGVDFLVARYGGRMGGDEIAKSLAQFVDVGGAGAQSLDGSGVIQQREQQVLHGDELVPLLARLDKGHVQADFEFLCDHVSSIRHCRGCWCLSE